MYIMSKQATVAWSNYWHCDTWKAADVCACLLTTCSSTSCSCSALSFWWASSDSTFSHVISSLRFCSNSSSNAASSSRATSIHALPRLRCASGRLGSTSPRNCSLAKHLKQVRRSDFGHKDSVMPSCIFLSGPYFSRRLRHRTIRFAHTSGAWTS